MIVNELFRDAGFCCAAVLLGALIMAPGDRALAQVQAPSQDQNQAGTGTKAVPAPDPRVAEAQRRLMLSHRRRAREALEYAQNAQLLTSTAAPEAAATPRSAHRGASMHRRTTALGRRAVRPAPAAAATTPAVTP
jgi:hypothetical protein